MTEPDSGMDTGSEEGAFGPGHGRPLDPEDAAELRNLEDDDRPDVVTAQEDEPGFTRAVEDDAPFEG